MLDHTDRMRIVFWTNLIIVAVLIAAWIFGRLTWGLGAQILILWLLIPRHYVVSRRRPSLVRTHHP